MSPHSVEPHSNGVLVSVVAFFVAGWAWLFRRHVRKFDDLEANSVTRREVIEMKRENAMEHRDMRDSVLRIHEKIDGLHEEVHAIHTELVRGR